MINTVRQKLRIPAGIVAVTEDIVDQVHRIFNIDEAVAIAVADEVFRLRPRPIFENEIDHLHDVGDIDRVIPVEIAVEAPYLHVDIGLDGRIACRR